MANRKVREGYDELEREQLVRKRCYDKWVKDGKLSRTDAIDRFERLATAIYFIRMVLNAHPEWINNVQEPVNAPAELESTPTGDAPLPF